MANTKLLRLKTGAEKLGTGEAKNIPTPPELEKLVNAYEANKNANINVNVSGKEKGL